MRLVFIIFFILSSSSQALLIKNNASDHRDGCFVDGSGNEAPLKLLLTKVAFPDDHRNGTPNSHVVLLEQSIYFGESLEINFADYFPNYELGDDVFLSALLGGKTNQMFVNKLVTTQGLPLREDDIVIFWADVFFAQNGNARGTPLQPFYVLQYYVAGIEQERPELLLGPDDSESEEERSS